MGVAPPSPSLCQPEVKEETMRKRESEQIRLARKCGMYILPKWFVYSLIATALIGLVWV
jgi:hypothetical protein